MTSLTAILRQSCSDPYLLAGPPASKAGWVYRDFAPMPQAVWLELLALLGSENIEVVAANKRQLPPAELCRAQMFISPAAQAAWTAYPEQHP